MHPLVDPASHNASQASGVSSRADRIHIFKITLSRTLTMTSAVNLISPAVHGTVNLPQLISLAIEGLVPMYDAEKRLFCHRIVNSEGSFVRDGLSPRYTMITLLGLCEFEKAGGRSPFDQAEILDSLIRNTDWIKGIGDLGLLLWTFSVLRPNDPPTWIQKLDIDHALSRYPDAQQQKTMELAWFITGLCHSLLTPQPANQRFADLALQAYRKLEKNQGSSGFFGHLGAKATLTGMLRSSIGCFADQVYPIYAMTRLAQACGLKEPLARAVDCAQAICRAQGSLGQWWWHYDSRRGQVARKYPVYSVHQDGMAPMALFAVGRESGLDFSTPIYKGLQWITGQNELKSDLRDFSDKVIWRCILPRSKNEMYVDEALRVLRVPSKLYPAGPLRVLPECRPYHFGWLLYAFAPILRGSSL